MICITLKDKPLCGSLKLMMMALIESDHYVIESDIGEMLNILKSTVHNQVEFEDC